MLYFSNKPAPTPGSMLPQPIVPSAVVNEPSDKRSLKRKQSASAESGLRAVFAELIDYDEANRMLLLYKQWLHY